MYQCSKHGWVSIYDPCPQCITIGVSIASDNTEINIQPSTPDKKLTPMGELIEYLKQSITDEQYVIDNASKYHGSDVLQAKHIVNSVTLCINKATSLLEAEREYASQQATEGMYTREQMMDIAGWMAAADNKRPVSELKEEAEEYIRKIDVAKQFIQSLK